jgi:hypothetical protein
MQALPTIFQGVKEKIMIKIKGIASVLHGLPAEGLHLLFGSTTPYINCVQPNNLANKLTGENHNSILVSKFTEQWIYMFHDPLHEFDSRLKKSERDKRAPKPTSLIHHFWSSSKLGRS